MKKTLLDYDINGKCIVLRCDLNVPIKDGKIVDTTRIDKAIDTIKYILSNNAKVVILSHLGRIKSLEDKDKNTLLPVYEYLKNILGYDIEFYKGTRSSELTEIVNKMELGTAILLENTRFEDYPNKLESGCDLELSKYWASLGDIFISDAFGTLHRGHASNCGIANYLDSGIGFLVSKELNELDKLDDPLRPFVVIMGGSKVSDKLDVITNLVKRVDYLLIGGAMGLTFLKAKGIDIKKSLCEDEYLSFCKDLLEKYSQKIILPVDYYGSNNLENDVRLCDINSFDDDFCGYDIGIQTIDLFKKYINGSKTIFWNGPLGVYENKLYQNGTRKIMNYIIENKSYNILGGGDIVSCAELFGLTEKISYVSTGGGASLEYIVNKDLEGLKCIDNKE